MDDYGDAEIRAAFDVFDKNKDGTVSLKEIREMMKALHIDMSDRLIKRMIEQLDSTGSGTIDYAEFKRAAEESRYDEANFPTDEEFLETFQEFDRDGTGYLTRKDIVAAMKQMDIKHIYTDEMVDEFIRTSDLNRDGKIDFHEFLNAMKNKNLHNARKNSDPKPIHIAGDDEWKNTEEGLRGAFNIFDTNKDGHISLKEFRNAVRVVGSNKSYRDLEKLFRSGDMDFNGTIDFYEFKALMKPRPKERHPRPNNGAPLTTSTLERAFRDLDVNNDGHLTLHEMTRLVQRLGIGSKFSSDDLQRILRETDINGDGLISKEEFFRALAT